VIASMLKEPTAFDTGYMGIATTILVQQCRPQKPPSHINGQYLVFAGRVSIRDGVQYYELKQSALAASILHSSSKTYSHVL